MILLLSEVHTVRITLFHSNLIIMILFFLGSFVVLRLVIRLWDLIGF